MVNGAKMGQTVRQTMPFNAHYAFVQAGKNARYGQQTRVFPAKTTTYPSTIGVCSDIAIDRLTCSCAFISHESLLKGVALALPPSGMSICRHGMVGGLRL